MSTEEVKKHTWVYFTVFGSLALLTILTVAVASLELAVGLAIGVGMTIALVKGSLVISFFMHLVSEKSLISLILILTFIFFIALLVLPLGEVISNVGVRNVP